MSLPSEVLEPALVDAVGLSIRELICSGGELADWIAFRNQVKGIGRVAICNADRGTGIHASVAANNALMMADRALRWPVEQRQAFLKDLRKGS